MIHEHLTVTGISKATHSDVNKQTKKPERLCHLGLFQFHQLQGSQAVLVGPNWKPQCSHFMGWWTMHLEKCCVSSDFTGIIMKRQNIKFLSGSQKCTGDPLEGNTGVFQLVGRTGHVCCPPCTGAFPTTTWAPNCHLFFLIVRHQNQIWKESLTLSLWFF